MMAIIYDEIKACCAHLVSNNHSICGTVSELGLSFIEHSRSTSQLALSWIVTIPVRRLGSGAYSAGLSGVPTKISESWESDICRPCEMLLRMRRINEGFEI